VPRCLSRHAFHTPSILDPGPDWLFPAQRRLVLDSPKAAQLNSDELNVCETVFRYQIDRLQKEFGEEISTHYLSIRSLNPPGDLLRRLRADNLSVTQGSRFQMKYFDENGAWHSVIRDFERVDARTFRVRGGYDNGPLATLGEEYTVVFRSGEWVVDHVVGLWVSYVADPDGYVIEF